MLEREIEQRLMCGVERLGGLCYKWTSPSCRGVPDRIVILPSGKVWFVEIKAEGGRLGKVQQYEIKKRNANVCVLQGWADVVMFLNEV